MKRLLALCLIVTAATFAGCDIPEVDFYERTIEVAATGGEMIIPVHSSGIDDVRLIEYGSNNKGWLTVVEVIVDYKSQTRALATWDSGIKVKFTANNSGKRRTVRVVANSFGAEDRVIIRQPSL